MKKLNYLVITIVLFSSPTLISCGTTKVVYRPVPKPPVRVIRPLPRTIVRPVPVVVYPQGSIVVIKTPEK